MNFWRINLDPQVQGFVYLNWENKRDTSNSTAALRIHIWMALNTQGNKKQGKFLKTLSLMTKLNDLCLGKYYHPYTHYKSWCHNQQISSLCLSAQTKSHFCFIVWWNWAKGKDSGSWQSAIKSFNLHLSKAIFCRFNVVLVFKQTNFRFKWKPFNTK